MNDRPCETCNHELTISEIRSLTDSRPRGRTLTFAGLRGRLSTSTERPEKGGPLFSAVRYRDGATRGNDGVAEVTASIFEIDGGGSIEEAKAHLVSAGLEFVLHTSYSFTFEHPKFRVVVTLSRPLTPDGWVRLWPVLNQVVVRAHVDPATKDPARAFYLPSHPPGATPLFFVGHGRAPDVDRLPLPPSGGQQGIPTPSPVRPVFEPTADVKAHLARVSGASPDGPVRGVAPGTTGGAYGEGSGGAQERPVVVPARPHRPGSSDSPSGQPSPAKRGTNGGRDRMSRSPPVRAGAASDASPTGSGAKVGGAGA